MRCANDKRAEKFYGGDELDAIVEKEGEQWPSTSSIERIDKYSVAIPRTSLPKAPQRQIKMLLESGHLGIITSMRVRRTQTSDQLRELGEPRRSVPRGADAAEPVRPDLSRSPDRRPRLPQSDRVHAGPSKATIGRRPSVAGADNKLSAAKNEMCYRERFFPTS